MAEVCIPQSTVRQHSFYVLDNTQAKDETHVISGNNEHNPASLWRFCALCDLGAVVQMP